MASSIIFVTLALVAASVLAPVMGTDFIVGDDRGWTLNFDQAWAEGKQFYVGDNLGMSRAPPCLSRLCRPKRAGHLSKRD